MAIILSETNIHFLDFFLF